MDVILPHLAEEKKKVFKEQKSFLGKFQYLEDKFSLETNLHVTRLSRALLEWTSLLTSGVSMSRTQMESNWTRFKDCYECFHESITYPRKSIDDLFDFSPSTATFWVLCDLPDEVEPDKFEMAMYDTFADCALVREHKVLSFFGVHPDVVRNMILYQIAIKDKKVVTISSLKCALYVKFSCEEREYFKSRHYPIKEIFQALIRKFAVEERKTTTDRQHDDVSHSAHLYETGKTLMRHRKWIDALREFIRYKKHIDAKKPTSMNPHEDNHLLYLAMCQHELTSNPNFELSGSDNVWIELWYQWIEKYPLKDPNKRIPSYFDSYHKSKVQQSLKIYEKGKILFKKSEWEQALQQFLLYKKHIDSGKTAGMSPNDNDYLFCMAYCQHQINRKLCYNMSADEFHHRNVYLDLWYKWTILYPQIGDKTRKDFPDWMTTYFELQKVKSQK
jgi:hypothetical protein